MNRDDVIISNVFVGNEEVITFENEVWMSINEIEAALVFKFDFEIVANEVALIGNEAAFGEIEIDEIGVILDPEFIAETKISIAETEIELVGIEVDLIEVAFSEMEFTDDKIGCDEETGEMRVLGR